jgi:hypothetical protein
MQNLDNDERPDGIPVIGRPEFPQDVRGPRTDRESTLKRKAPHQMPNFTPSKVGSANKTSPSTAGTLSAAETTGAVAGQQKPKKMKMTKSYAQPFGETLTAKKISKDQISPDGIGRTPLALPEVPSHAPEPVAEVPTGFKQFADDALAANANLEPEEEAARMAAALHVPSPLRFDPIRNAFTCNLPARPPSPSAVPKIIAPTVVVTASPSPGPAAVHRYLELQGCMLAKEHLRRVDQFLSAIDG